MIEQEQWDQDWPLIVGRAWADEDFKRQLLAEPEVLLQQLGWTIPAGVQVKVLEDTDQLIHLVLPAPPPPKPIEGLKSKTIEGLDMEKLNAHLDLLKRLFRT